MSMSVLVLTSHKVFCELLTTEFVNENVLFEMPYRPILDAVMNGLHFRTTLIFLPYQDKLGYPSF